MSLLKFFTVKEKKTSVLPSPTGPLSKEIPSSSIVAANAEVSKVLNEKFSIKRGEYTKLTSKEKAEIGKRASEHGIASTIRHLAKKYPNLKESSVRTWKNIYLAELRRRRTCQESLTITELPEKKKGRPLLLGDQLEFEVIRYLKDLRIKGAVVNTAIAVSCAKGIVLKANSNFLASNGGHIVLTNHWGKHLLNRMGFVAKVMVENFEEVKAQFLLDIKAVVEFHDIPSSLTINWDQTGIHYVPAGSWTMEKEGSKRVEIAAVDDKHQITAVFAASLVGEFLPSQLIYKGTTKRCLPTITFPPDWHITCSSNHWANESTMIDYINKILIPYLSVKRKELKLPSNYPALVIFDKFTAQGTDQVLQILQNNNIYFVMVPANTTDRLQPLDISVNKPAKDFLRNQFQEWYADQVCQQLKGAKAVQPVDLKLSVMKPLGAKWMIKLFDHFCARPEVIVNGFRAAGIKNIIMP